MDTAPSDGAASAERRAAVTIMLLLLLVPAAAFLSYWLRRRGLLSKRGGDLRTPRVATRRQRSTDSRRLGYRYADDKIFIHGDGVYTGVVLGTDTDEFATADEIDDYAMRPVRIYRSLLDAFDGEQVQCHELVRYRSVITTGWCQQLLDNAWHPTELYRVLAGRVAGHIANSTPQRMWSLIVRLGDAPVGRTGDPYAGAAAAVTGVFEEHLTGDDLTGWWARADHLHDTLSRHGADPLTRRDLLWLIRRPGHGHLPVPDAPVTSRRPWRGGFFELAAGFRGHNTGGGFLELHRRDPDTGQEQTSYTATLVITNQPPRQLFNPRNAWSRRLAHLATPAEISWRYTLIPAQQWKRMTEKTVANVDDEGDDRDKAGAAPDQSFLARLDQAAQLRRDSGGDDPEPGMIGRLRLTVSAPTRPLLARAIQDLKAAMGDVAVDVPEHAALPLLLEQLPGEPASTSLGSLSAGPAGGIRLWQRWSDTYLPAIALLGSHNQIGDRQQIERGRTLGWIGMAVGWVKDNGSVVSCDPHAQIARGHGAGVAVLGSSGGGKTSFALLLFFWLSESGVRCSVLDPKIEFSGFVYYLAFGSQVMHPQFMLDADAGVLGTPASRFQPVNRPFWDDTAVVDLARGARGSQDPWRITRTFTDGYNLALSLTDVLWTDDAHRRIVRKGLRLMLAAHKSATAGGEPFPCGFGDVLSYIRLEREELETDYRNARQSGGDTSTLRQSRDEFDEVCTRLENGEDMPFLRLLLGRGDDGVAQDVNATKRRLIYTMAGFKTPDHPDNPELWTDEDRNASAAMLAVLSRMRRDNLSGRFAHNPATGEMGIPPTAAFIDEGNMVTASPAGRAYLTVNLRQGRSLGSVLVFMDQQARGIKRIEEEARREDAAEVNQFGVVAVFRQRSRREALSALELLRSSDGDDARGEVTALARKLQSEDVGGLLRPGDCVLRDPDSRVAAVTVDQIFYVLQRASQTNPKLKPVDWSVDVPADPHAWEINPEALLQVRTNVVAAAHAGAEPPLAPAEPWADLEDQLIDDDLELTQAPGWTEPAAGGGATTPGRPPAMAP